MKKKWLKVLCCVLSAVGLLVLLVLASGENLYGERDESDTEAVSDVTVSSVAENAVSEGDVPEEGSSAVVGIEEWDEIEESPADSTAVFDSGLKESETGSTSRPVESTGGTADGVGNGSSENSGSQSSSSDAVSSAPVSGQEPSTEDQTMSFEAYLALTPHQQQEFYLKFETPEAFLDWYDAAKAKYEESIVEVEVNSDGTIDIGGIIEEQNGKNDG